MSLSRSFTSRFAQVSGGWRFKPALLVVLAACSAAAGAVHAQPSSSLRVTEVTQASHPYTTWHCARETLKTRIIGQSLEVVLGDDSRLLTQAISASGARYVAPGDADTEFWGKGRQATVRWSGRALAPCVEQGELATPLRASGNEPFWAVDYDGWRLALSRPGQPVRHFDIEGRAASGEGWQLQGEQDGQALSIDIQTAICVDSMSGLPRPYTVSITMNGETMQGCGGDAAQLLQGVRWKLTAMGGQAVALPAWLQFLPDGRLAGSNGCNRLMGAYDISGEGVRFSQLATTRMACPSDIMAQAGKLDQYLASVHGFSFDAQGALVLKAEQGDLLWKPAADLN